MSYQIELEFHPLYELISSMAVFINPRPYYDLEKQWFKMMESKVPSSFIDNIQDEERKLEIGYLLLMISKCPYKNSLLDFLQWFHTFSVEDMHQLLDPYFGDNSLEDLQAFRNFYSEALTIWNKVYSIDERITRALGERILLLKEESKTMDPVDFVEKCTNGIRIYPLEDLHQVLLVPSYHCAPLNRIYELNHTLFVHFAVDLLSESSIFPSHSFIRKTNALADPRRLKILQLLATEPKTFKEIGRVMKLSKSNLHNHLILLRTAGLVRITNYQFKKENLYTTRPYGFTALKDDIETFIFDNREQI